VDAGTAGARQREWTELLADVEAALGEDPGSAKAQALAVRWRTLVEGFTGGIPKSRSA
jgi:hypothetical protein